MTQQTQQKRGKKLLADLRKSDDPRRVQANAAKIVKAMKKAFPELGFEAGFGGRVSVFGSFRTVMADPLVDSITVYAKSHDTPSSFLVRLLGEASSVGKKMGEASKAAELRKVIGIDDQIGL